MEEKRYVLGLDLAMGCSGYAVYDLKFSRFVEIGSIDTEHIKKRKGVYQHAEKLRFIESHILKVKEKYNDNFHGIAIERGFSRFNNATQVIFRVHGVVNLIFHDFNQVYYPPKKVKSAILNGNATKKQVATEIIINFNSIEFKNEDESDATAVALTYLIENGMIDWKS